MTSSFTETPLPPPACSEVAGVQRNQAVTAAHLLVFPLVLAQRRFFHEPSPSRGAAALLLEHCPNGPAAAGCAPASLATMLARRMRSPCL